MENRFEALNNGEVLSVDESLVFLTGHGTFKIGEFTRILKEKMLESGQVTEEKIGWLTEEGIKCEVLKFGSTGWQKGKVRLHLEFSPDESSDHPSSQKKTETLVSSSEPELEVFEAVESELDLVEDSEDFTASAMDEDISEESFPVEDDPFAEEDLGSELDSATVSTEETPEIFGAEDEAFEDISQSIENELDNFETGEESIDFGDFGDFEESTEEESFDFGESKDTSFELDNFGESMEEESVDFGESKDTSFELGDFGESTEEESVDFGDLGDFGEEDFSLDDNSDNDLFGESDDNLFGEESSNSDDSLFGDDDIDDVWKDMQELS